MKPKDNKEVIDTTFEDDLTMEDRSICDDCGHHGFCKYEDCIEERVGNFAEAIKGIKIEEPLILGIQCQGYCRAVKKEES